jgi:RNase P subunit RPR2
MTPSRTVVRTGICAACQTRLTHVLVLESLERRREHGDIVEWRCPKCAAPGTIEGKASERLVGLQTNISR